MKKINLDEEFENFKKRFLEKFLEIHNFDSELEEAWRDYQRENDLVDKSNEIKE